MEQVLKADCLEGRQDIDLLADDQRQMQWVEAVAAVGRTLSLVMDGYALRNERLPDESHILVVGYNTATDETFLWGDTLVLVAEEPRTGLSVRSTGCTRHYTLRNGFVAEGEWIVMSVGSQLKGNCGYIAIHLRPLWICIYCCSHLAAEASDQIVIADPKVAELEAVSGFGAGMSHVACRRKTGPSR